MLPDFGLITKADKQKLDSIPSDTLLTEIDASNTYITKVDASNTYVTRADAQRYINDALDGGGGSSALGTINSSSSTYTTAQDGYYYNLSSSTIFSNASNSTIEARGYPVIYNSGSGNCYYANGLSETIYGFGNDDTLIVPSGDFSVKQSDDKGLRVNHGLGSTLLRGKRIAGTTGNAAENFATIPKGTNLKIQAKNLNRTVYETVLGTASNETIWNSDMSGNNPDLGEHVWIKGLAGNDTIICGNGRSHCTIEAGTGTDYIFNEGGDYNVYIYNSGDGVINICGFNLNDTLVINGVTANSVQGAADGSFYAYCGNTSNYVRLLSNERKEAYQADAYIDKYDLSYYWTIEGGNYIHLKNNTDELVDQIIFGKTEGGFTNTTGNRYDNTKGRDYWECVFTGNNQTFINTGDYCTVSSSVAGSHYVYDDSEYGTFFRRKMATGYDSIFGYKSGETLQVTDGSSDSVICAPTVDGGYTLIFSPDNYEYAQRTTFKGSRIDGTTANNAASYNPLDAGDYIAVQFGTSEQEVDYFVPEIYYMTATKYTNTADEIWICGTAADNTIENSGLNVSINSCNGANSVTNDGDNCFILTGTGNDTIRNTGDYVSIYGGSSINSIYNDGDYVSIFGGSSTDSIYNTGDGCTLNGSNGTNRFTNSGSQVLMIGGTGTDSLVNTGDYCTLQASTGAAYVTLTSDAETSADYCYIEAGDSVTLSANAQAPTLSVVNGTASVSLGADCSHASIVCAATGSYQDTIRSTGGAGNNGYHYIFLGNAPDTYRSPQYCYLYDAYNTVVAGEVSYNNIYVYNPDSLDGAGSSYNYVQFGNRTNYFYSYGTQQNTIIGGTSNEYICYYAADSNYSNTAYKESIITGAGNDYITLHSGAHCTIESGAGSDKIWIPYSGGYNVFSYGGAEGINSICGVDGNDTLFIKDDSEVSIGANTTNGLALKIGTSTYVTLKGEVIAGQTNLAAIASYSSINSGAAVCTIKYSSGTTNTLYAP